MTDRSRAIADEAIRQAREACYGDANVGNTIEGDYGKWDDWRDMIEEVVERSCERLSHAEAEREAWCASYHAAQSDVRSVEAKLAAAEDALQALYDYQNGCPLPTYRVGWTAAMVMAENVLRDADERLEKQIAAKEVLG